MEEYDQPSTSGTSNFSHPVSTIDQDKIVFAFEREYFQNFQPLEQKAKAKSAAGFFNPFQNGLQLRDQDLVDFLNERLGDHEETWAGKNVAAFLSREMIEELETCFQGLEPIAKLKIVLGFSQLSAKRLNDWKKEINTLLEIAARDPDDWVEAISDMLRIFSPTGIIELVPTKNIEMYREGLGRVYHKLLEVANRPNSRYCHIPEAYHYCDEAVIENELMFTPPEEQVHFTLKKNHKAEQQREDCLKELLNPKPVEDKGGIVTSLPMKFRSTLRKPDLKTPMKGIVQPNASKINGGFTSEPKKFPRQLAKRDGGALLISIDDIPHAHMKRKKDIEKEEREKKKEQAEVEKKKVEAERKKANAEKAELKKKAMKEAEKAREEAMKRRQEMEAAKLPDPIPAQIHAPPPRGPMNHRDMDSMVQRPIYPMIQRPHDPMLAFADPSLELERLRQQFPSTSSDVKLDDGEEGEIKGETGDEPMEESMMQSEADKAVEWMFHHDDQMGEKKEDDYEFVNRPRPPGLESRETIIQKTATELIDTITCCPLEHQRQIVAFISGNTTTFRPMLGKTNVIKISDSIQQGIVGTEVCRVRVESFVNLNFETCEWKRQQKCKILVGEEQPRDFDGSIGPRLSHQQVFNEIARHITDEPEDVKFAGQSVIVQAYVPPPDLIDIKLLSPGGSKGSTDVLYGHEVTAGEMETVQTGIAGCIRMRTILGNTNLLSPVLIAASLPVGSWSSSMPPPSNTPKSKAPAKKAPKPPTQRKAPQKQQAQPASKQLMQPPQQQQQQAQIQVQHTQHQPLLQLSFDSPPQQQPQKVPHQPMRQMPVQASYMIQQTPIPQSQPPMRQQRQPQQMTMQQLLQSSQMQQSRQLQHMQQGGIQQHRQPQQQIQHHRMMAPTHSMDHLGAHSNHSNRNDLLPVKQLSIPQFVQRSMVQIMNLPNQNQNSSQSVNKPPCSAQNSQSNVMQSNPAFYGTHQFSHNDPSMVAMNPTSMSIFNQIAQSSMSQQQTQSFQLPHNQMQDVPYHTQDFHGLPNQQQQYRY